ncbi:MAG: serine/threonine protein kinase [Deltaproteobacteria bacterium]|nr:serine/threonine protein kinase [Deltaproteobacteria bacterium]
MIVNGAVVDGKYRIVRPLGGGAMGKVYLAEKVSTHERFAIKFIHDYLVSDETYYARFEREINALRGIRHPHVVATYDWQLPPRGKGGNAYIVMEYLTGESMQQALLHPLPVPTERIVRVMLQVLDGLGAVHALGVIHRDLSPANIFISGSDPGYPSAKIVDFGLAKGEAASSSSDSSGGVTQDGAVLGRAAYAAPEMFLGRELDPRADVFACGMILYRTLAGRFPYRETRTELMWVERYSQRHEEGRPYPAARSFKTSIPPALDHVISIAVRKRPQERYQTADQMLRDLLKVEEQLGYAPKGDGTAVEVSQGPALPDMESIPDTTRIDVPTMATPPALSADSGSPTPGPADRFAAEGSSRGSTARPQTWSTRHPRGRIAIALSLVGVGLVAVLLALFLRGGGSSSGDPGRRGAAGAALDGGVAGRPDGADTAISVAAIDARSAGADRARAGAVEALEAGAAASDAGPATPDAGTGTPGPDGAAEGDVGAEEARPTEILVTLDGMPAGALGTVGDVKVEDGAARVPFSEDPLLIKVTAAGYIEFETEITPNRDTVVLVFMDPVATPDAGTPPPPADAGVAARRDAGTVVVRRDAGSTPRRDAGSAVRRDAGTAAARDAGSTASRDAGARREGGIGIITTYGP